MRKNILVALLLMCTAIMQAQELRFTIRGELTNDSLRYTAQRVEQLFLKRTIDGVETTVDTATVSNGVFTFSGVAPAEVEMCNITGFDNGSIQVFLEPGDITVGPFDARFPVAARIGGTPGNKVMQGFYDVNQACIASSKERMKEAMENVPADIKDDEAAKLAWTSPTFYVNNFYFKLEIMNYISDNIESPLALYMIKYSMMPAFTPDVIENVFLKAVPASLHKSKMYKELVNDIRAANLKEGSIAPDISGRTTEGKEFSLSDFGDKYILLDFWASWCAPCRREFPFLKEALAYSEKNERFMVLSYSIDSKEKDWVNCIEKNDLKHKNWIHISALKGWNSEAAKLFNVQGVPHTVLIGPGGKVIGFNLRGEEMVKKVKAIIDGEELIK